MKTHHTLIVVGAFVLVAAGIVGTVIAFKPSSTVNQVSNTGTSGTTLTAADQAGRELSAQRCTGTDKTLLTHLPMRPQDFSVILPYGLVVGGHVTPIDHQYFSPMDFQSAPDTYDVYAMGDARIVGIGTRQHAGFGKYANTTVTDYRLVFSISCRLFYYYDLVTSLAPDLKAAYEQQGNNIDFPVTAGQVIGKIGGQTLDFAVWDTDTHLTGFVNLDDYVGESWKQYTVDPLNYYTDELKTQALAKYVRTVEPRSGKIDYDVDGRLIGNWFAVGTNGYAGNCRNGCDGYWTGHLSIAPHYIDPTVDLASIGNWPGGASQFAIGPNDIDPAEVSPSSGPVKYTLVEYREQLPNGQLWNGSSFPTLPLKLHRYTDTKGCLMVQMTGDRTLDAEAFKGKACSAVTGFTDAVVHYER